MEVLLSEKQIIINWILIHVDMQKNQKTKTKHKM